MMREHPIEGLMSAAMSSIQDMVDVNTIIGDPIETSNSIVIIPISKVCFGFAAGGSEFSEETIDEYTKKEKEEENIKYKLPFRRRSRCRSKYKSSSIYSSSRRKCKIITS